MSLYVFANNVSTTLVDAISSSATTITLASTANVPSTIPAGYVWPITLNDAATQTFFEIVYATANLGGGQFTVVRGQEGTSARSWGVGDFTFAAVTAGMLGGFQQLGGILPIANGGTGTSTPALVAGTNVTITGSWPNQTINASSSGGTVTSVTASSPLSSSGGTTPNITMTSPLPIANGGTNKTTALTVKLAIAMGFQSGAVSTSTTFPTQPIVGYASGTITGIRAAAGTVDNGTTVYSIHKNGSSVATITLSTSTVTNTSASFSIAAGDYLTMVCTAAGTAHNVGVVLEGTQAAS